METPSPTLVVFGAALAPISGSERRSAPARGPLSAGRERRAGSDDSLSDCLTRPVSATVTHLDTVQDVVRYTRICAIARRIGGGG